MKKLESNRHRQNETTLNVSDMRELDQETLHKK